MVTIRLIAAASLVPRRMIRKNDHNPSEDSSTAISVSPAPSAGNHCPSVDMMSTQ